MMIIIDTTRGVCYLACVGLLAQCMWILDIFCHGDSLFEYFQVCLDLLLCVTHFGFPV